jgi:hypothetical protein
VSPAVGSSVPTVKAELVTLFQAVFAGDADPVTVMYGPRVAKTFTEDRLVSVLGMKGENEDDSLGDAGASFVERYQVLVVCSVDLAGPDEATMQAASEGAQALWRRCRAALRTAPGPASISPAAIAAGVQKATAAREWELQEAATAEGRTAAVRWSVDVWAQITT